MPELPEVETIRRHLAPRVENRTLTALQIDDARWCRPLSPQELAAAVTGRVVERLGRRGKYLVWQLSGEVFLFCHLRMTGTFLLDPTERPPHTRVRFELDAGSSELVFVDPRRFGTGELALGEDAHDAFFAARLGVEPLGPEFTGEYLRALAKSSRAPST
jgi:formamidopyrimidine-DNA glycosylase